MSAPQFNLSFRTSDSTFELKVYDVASVKYEVSYMAEEPVENTADSPGEVAHGFSGSGAAVRGVFSDEQIAGTKSGEDIVYHVVKSGSIELSGTSSEGEAFSLVRDFTISKQGKLQISEASQLGSVLGAETATPSMELMMATPAADVMMQAEPMVTTQTEPVTDTEELTVTPVGVSTRPEVPSLVLLAGVMLIAFGVVAGIAWWVKRKKSA